MPRQRKSTAPLFSARHYEFLAAFIREEYKAIHHDMELCLQAKSYRGAAHCESTIEQIDIFAHRLACALNVDSSKFKYDQFVKACKPTK